MCILISALTRLSEPLPDLSRLQQLHTDATVKPAVVQNRFYAESGHDCALRAFCRANDMAYQSFWTLTANPLLLEHQAIRNCSKRLGKTPAQCMYRFLMHLGATPLNGTCNAQHMAEDLQAARNEFALSLDEVRALAAAIGDTPPDALADA